VDDASQYQFADAQKYQKYQRKSHDKLHDLSSRTNDSGNEFTAAKPFANCKSETVIEEKNNEEKSDKSFIRNSFSG
jgi:hypothetical protein